MEYCCCSACPVRNTRKVSVNGWGLMPALIRQFAPALDLLLRMLAEFAGRCRRLAPRRALQDRRGRDGVFKAASKASFNWPTTDSGVPVATIAPNQSSTTRLGRPSSTNGGDVLEYADPLVACDSDGAQFAGCDQFDHRQICQESKLRPVGKQILDGLRKLQIGNMRDIEALRGAEYLADEMRRCADAARMRNSSCRAGS